MAEEGRSLLSEVLFAALLLATPAYFTWNTITLMDNALWGALLLLTSLLVASNRLDLSTIGRCLPVFILLLLITRPESLLWSPVFILVLFLRGYYGLGPLAAFRTTVPSLLAYASGVLGLTIFRLAYFGFPLPNTFYAKVSPSLLYNLTEGSKYLGRYFVSHPIVTTGIISVLLGTAHILRKIAAQESIDDGREFIPALAAVGLLVPVLTGGDHFGSYRF